MKLCNPLVAAIATATALLLGILALSAHAAVPSSLNYQGFLTDATTGQPQTTAVSVTFKLYDALSAGNLIYAETQTITPVNGTFNAQIGSGSGTPSFSTVTFDQPYWLEITVGAQILSPRQPLASSATALRAKVAETALVANSLSAVPGTGTNNIAYGAGALQANTTGYNNTASGINALHANTSGNGNTAYGNGALYSDTTGWTNTAFGDGALYSNNGNFNTAHGSSALNANTTGYGNTANGAGALNFNTTGSSNVANGMKALYSNTTGYQNTANGYYALYSNTSGFNDTANGYHALYANTTGSDNIALGYLAGMNLTAGNYNIDIGNQGVAGEGNTIRIGDSNQTKAFMSGISGVTPAAGALPVVIDSNGQLGTAASLTVLQAVPGAGTSNTAYGTGALQSNNGGDFNTATGSSVLSSNTTGYANTANGDSALISNTTGYFNTAIGGGALSSNTIGNNNIALGFQAGNNLTTGNNNIDIGNSGVAGESRTIRIGTAGTQMATYLAGNVYSNGTFTNSSDVNIKTDFAAISPASILAKVAALPLSAWRYKADPKEVRHIGPMAQDFASAFAVGQDDKHIATVDESGVALAAIKGLYLQLLAEKQGNKAKAKKISNLEKELAAIKAKLGLN